jgi:hypothetical protein
MAATTTMMLLMMTTTIISFITAIIIRVYIYLRAQLTPFFVS